MEFEREYRTFVYNAYTHIPEGHEQLRKLDLGVDEDDFVWKRVKAVVRFLSYYQYTLAPGSMPEEADFVDYFLFENKKGYCVHFASPGPCVPSGRTGGSTAPVGAADASGGNAACSGRRRVLELYERMEQLLRLEPGRDGPICRYYTINFRIIKPLSAYFQKFQINSAKHSDGGKQLFPHEKLGVPFYDNELITRAAKESGFAEAAFANAESKATNSLLYSIAMGMNSYGNQELGFSSQCGT